MIRATSTVPVDDAQRAYARLAGFVCLVVLALDIAGVVMTSVIRGHGTFVETIPTLVPALGHWSPRHGRCEGDASAKMCPLGLG